MELIHLLGIHVDLPVWFILLCITLVVYYNYMNWNNGIFQEIGVPYDKPYPFLGSFIGIAKKGLNNYDMSLHKKYGRVVGSFFGHAPILHVNDPAVAKQVFVKQWSSFGQRFDYFYQRRVSEVNAAMLTEVEDTEKWKSLRTTLTPTFSTGKLKQMTQHISRSANQVMKHLEDNPDTKTCIDFKKFTDAFTMDVIAAAGFGIQLDTLKDGGEFVKNAQPFFDFSFANKLAAFYVFAPFLIKPAAQMGMSFFAKKETEFFADIVRRTMKEREKLDMKGQIDLLQLMINSHNLPTSDEDKIEDGENGVAHAGGSKRKLTEQELVAQAILFFIAGYFTTSNTASCTAHCLLANPECQDKVIQEIKDVIEDQEEIKYDDLKKLKYLQQCIDETLRLYPLAPRIDRVANEDVTIDGIFMPRGMDVSISVGYIHNNPDYWPNPEKFDPDRFTEEAKSKRDPFTYLPFGAGPRNCIGMRFALTEIKMILAKILLKYRFVACPKTEIPLKKVAPFDLVMNFWMKLEEHGL